MPEELKELRVSNDAMADPEELRRRLDEEGYVFFKRLQDPDKLRALRHEMFSVIQQGGWLVADTDPMDGIANIAAQCTEGDLGYTDVYHEVYKLENFHRSAHWPEVMSMMETLMGKPVMAQPQKVARPAVLRHDMRGDRERRDLECQQRRHHRDDEPAWPRPQQCLQHRVTWPTSM